MKRGFKTMDFFSVKNHIFSTDKIRRVTTWFGRILVVNYFNDTTYYCFCKKDECKKHFDEISKILLKNS